jgi:Raf kinase inhibitor-like YbhB/YbcL family protein
VRLAALASTLLVLAACGGGGGSGTKLKEGPTAEGFQFTSDSQLAEGQAIDARFTCDGADVAPGLVWNGVPGDAKQLALAFEDPDAPGGTFTHWLVYKLDPKTTHIPGAPRALEGENDFGRTGYGGPCPPEGHEHQYVLRLLALDASVGLEAGADRKAFDDAVAPHVIAEARLTAPYQRG